MKVLLTITAFLMFSSTQAQIDTNDLIGDWEYQNITSNNVPLDNGPDIDQFTLHIKKDGSFKMTSGKRAVNGTWKLDQQSLMLTGARENSEDIKTEILTIYSLSDSNLAITVSGELPEGVVMNLKKIKS